MKSTKYQTMLDEQKKGEHKHHGKGDAESAKKAPEVKAPEVKAPEVKAPEVKAPEVKAPEKADDKK